VEIRKGTDDWPCFVSVPSLVRSSHGSYYNPLISICHPLKQIFFSNFKFRWEQKRPKPLIATISGFAERIKLIPISQSLTAVSGFLPPPKSDKHSQKSENSDLKTGLIGQRCLGSSAFPGSARERGALPRHRRCGLGVGGRDNKVHPPLLTTGQSAGAHLDAPVVVDPRR